MPKRNKKTAIISIAIVLFLIPITVLCGTYFLSSEQYYITGILIIIYIMFPFFMAFEGRRPQARELVIISVLCAVAIVGRAALFMLPNFKPVIAVVVISGICFGGATGFLVGAISGFVSNFFFAQGPWTPWQMFAFGIIGFCAGIIFNHGILPKGRLWITAFGALSTFFIFGGIMNFYTVLSTGNKPSLPVFLTTYLAAIQFDLIHAFATALFLFFFAPSVIEMLERIKKKYGLIQ